jgi:hypothetical protein
MTRTDLEAWLVRRGYAPDRWGHYQKDAYSHIDGQTRRYRWRLSKTHARREVQCHHADGSADWVRLGSAPYSALYLTATGDQLQGLRR